MQGTCEEFFLIREEDDSVYDLGIYDALGDAQEWARRQTQTTGHTIEIWHLDFKAGRMTLIKVYKPRPTSEEELVEYV